MGDIDSIERGDLCEAATLLAFPISGASPRGYHSVRPGTTLAVLEVVRWSRGGIVYARVMEPGGLIVKVSAEMIRVIGNGCGEAP